MEGKMARRLGTGLVTAALLVPAACSKNEQPDPNPKPLPACTGMLERNLVGNIPEKDISRFIDYNNQDKTGSAWQAIKNKTARVTAGRSMTPYVDVTYYVANEYDQSNLIDVLNLKSVASQRLGIEKLKERGKFNDLVETSSSNHYARVTIVFNRCDM